MFNLEVYNQLKQDLELSYQYFDNLPANCSEKEFKNACDNISFTMGKLDVFLYHNKKENKKEVINE